MIYSESRSRFLSFLQRTRAFYISVKFTRVLILSLSVRSVCVVPLAESEGTLILPQVESYHRLQDDDATTVTSEDSFFSAAEVRSFICSLKTKKHNVADAFTHVLLLHRALTYVWFLRAAV